MTDTAADPDLAAAAEAKVVRMAEQIARAVANSPDPAAATATHINAFWAPHMRADLRSAVESGTPVSDTVRAVPPLLRTPKTGG